MTEPVQHIFQVSEHLLQPIDTGLAVRLHQEQLPIFQSEEVKAFEPPIIVSLGCRQILQVTSPTFDSKRAPALLYKES